MSGITEQSKPTISDAKQGEGESSNQSMGPIDLESATDRLDLSVGTERMASEPAEERPLPLDQTFEILKNQRRRYVLQFLEESDGPLRLGELAEHIAALENDKDVAQITSSERKRVYVGLYQCHLPKMDSMDVISFNKPRGIIEEGPNSKVLLPYIAPRTQSHERVMMQYSGVLMLVSVGLLFLTAALSTATSLPVLEVTALTVVSIFAVAAHSVKGTGGDSRGDATPSR